MIVVSFKRWWLRQVCKVLSHKPVHIGHGKAFSMPAEFSRCERCGQVSWCTSTRKKRRRRKCK